MGLEPQPWPLGAVVQPVVVVPVEGLAHPQAPGQLVDHRDPVRVTARRLMRDSTSARWRQSDW